MPKNESPAEQRLRVRINVLRRILRALDTLPPAERLALIEEIKADAIDATRKS